MKKLLIPIMLLFLVSCSTVQITSNYDNSVNFKEFNTFSMYPWNKHNDSLVNPYDKETIIMSVKSEMESRGYKHIEQGGDLIVSTFVILENKTNYQAYTNHYSGYAGFGGGWGYYASPWAYGYGWGPGYYGGATTITKVDYVQGTLMIDIFELANKKLVWQGIGTGEVDNNPATRDKRLPKNIGQIFKRFPIQKTGN
ncbi:MAG: DUF4136 domain-containing protein [Bacteroidetes bacterium]|nr:DUF4136 domain-containing protein [Bacteroidota bacterium]MBL6944082.1 DUF4136 domain-containing protein [Bacteroidales bacterium]